MLLSWTDAFVCTCISIGKDRSVVRLHSLYLERSGQDQGFKKADCAHRVLFRVQLEKSPSSAAIDRCELIYPFTLVFSHQSNINLDYFSWYGAFRFPDIRSRHPSFGAHKFLTLQHFVDTTRTHH